MLHTTFPHNNHHHPTTPSQPRAHPPPLYVRLFSVSHCAALTERQSQRRKLRDAASQTVEKTMGSQIIAFNERVHVRSRTCTCACVCDRQIEYTLLHVSNSGAHKRLAHGILIATLVRSKCSNANRIDHIGHSDDDHHQPIKHKFAYNVYKHILIVLSGLQTRENAPCRNP